MDPTREIFDLVSGPHSQNKTDSNMKSLLRVASICALVAVAGAMPVKAQYALQFGAAVTVSDNEVIVGEGRNLLLPGTVIVYTLDADGGWTQSQSLAPSDAGGEATGFGRALSYSNGTLFVGAPTKRSVYLYERNENGRWTESGKLSADAEGFGGTVAVDMDHALVAATGNRQTAGRVFSFHRGEDGKWLQTDELAAPDSVGPRAGYGRVLALKNRQAVIGAPGRLERSGTVYSFNLNETGTWESTGAIDFPKADNGQEFGSSLLLAGSRLAVGVPGYEKSTGAVAIFKRGEEGQIWVYDRRLSPFDATGGERFGTALALTNGQLWVGSPGYDAQQGMVYKFRINSESGRMTSTERLSDDGLQYRSSYGSALAANDNIAVVGAVGHDNFEGVVFPYARINDAWVAGRKLYNETGEFASVTGEMTQCAEGKAGEFDCSDVDMLSFLSREDIGAARGIQVNDVWGWEDPLTGDEYALVGRTDGTSFIKVTDAHNPVYIGDLPKTETANQSLWRDIKVYKDHAYIVADGAGAHHMQVFDLTQLRNVENVPVTFEETAIYKGVYSSHNIIINEETGYAYAVGSDSGGETCGGGLHMINIQDPANPEFAGCFADPRTGRTGTGATHDAQCVTYNGPDINFQGREICLSSNGTALSIADVTDKDNPIAISIAEYPNVSYAHQGWLTEDHRYFYLNDEGDEISEVVDATRTLIFDLAELEDPVLAGEYLAEDSSIDHNLYIREDLMYQANYSAGLRIINISDPENPVEVGHFDTVPYGKNDNSPVLGAWSNYPYFKSGIIIVTSGREGLFILKKTPVDS